MRKKILVAEKSDAIRSIAESILHQNGYEVLSASSLNKAREQIVSAQPNMVIIGADLKDDEGKFLYDSLEENENTASIPLLLIADPSGRSLPYPEEVILPRPFDPKDFIERVKLFVGGGIETPGDEKIKAEEPFSAETVDDEFLDAALGIDRIEVEDSEEMNKTSKAIKLPRKDQTGEKDVFEVHRPDYSEDEKLGDSNRVESLMIRDESQSSEAPEKKEEELSASSKIEIKADQYGLMEPKQSDEPETPATEATHDYHWFIKEMQKETKDAPGTESTGDKKDDHEHKLLSRPTSEIVEPVMPKPSPEPEISSRGVDQFISDFKEEVKQISSQPGFRSKAEKALSSSPEAEVDSAEIRHFVNNLVELISEKLAKKFVEKIDKDELQRIVKDDLGKLISQRK